MSFFIKVDSKHKVKLRFLVEDKLIMLKGRVSLNSTEYGVEANKFILDEISELEGLLNDLKQKTELYQLGDGSISEFKWG